MGKQRIRGVRETLIEKKGRIEEKRKWVESERAVVMHNRMLGSADYWYRWIEAWNGEERGGEGGERYEGG